MRSPRKCPFGARTVVAVLLVVAGGANISSAVAREAAVNTTIRMSTTLDASNGESGTFAATGVIVDKGTVRGVVHRFEPTLALTRTLTGKKGTIVLRVTGKFTDPYRKRLSFTWKVVSGTGTYKGLTGVGSGNGREVAGGRHLDVFTGTTRR